MRTTAVSLTLLALALPSPASAQDAIVDKAISDAVARCATVTLTRATSRDAGALARNIDCYRKAAEAAVNAMEARSKKLIEVTAAAPTPAPSPSPSPSPVPMTPPLGEWERSPTPTGQPGITARWNVAEGLQPSWGSGAIPASATPDIVGAFRMTCASGDMSYVDTIQYPGSDRLSHLHLFYGLLDVRPDDTYFTAQEPGRHSTCGLGDTSPNRSGYWMPAMLNGKGMAFQADYVSVYYKRFPKTSRYCDWTAWDRAVAAECRNMPNGLKMIAGRDMQKPGTNEQGTDGASFYCINDTTGRASATVDSLTILRTDAACQGSAKLFQVFDFPECWDGKNLDSPNHRDHMAYRRQDGNGNAKCPTSHPILIVQLHVAAQFQLLPEDDRSLIRLDSDMIPGLDPGKTQHGDAYISWEPTVFQALHDNCIDKLLNCSGGDLGNGLQIKPAVFPWSNPTRLVPVPPRPGGDHAGHD